MVAIRSIRVRITGYVQGVGFRAWTEQRANALGLSGWVRNSENGDVEALFSGSTEAVNAMLAACQQGPRHARVERVELVGPAAPPIGPFRIQS
jgi:acylphosphatase